MIALVVLTLVLVVLVMICLLALVDQYRTLELVRMHLGLDDAPRPLPKPHLSDPLAGMGLPPFLDAADHAVLLLLSTSCTTCTRLAAALRGRDLGTLHVVLRARSHHQGEEWSADAGLPAESVTVVTDDTIPDSLGLHITPAVVVFRGGVPLLAQTAPSYRQLAPLLVPGRVVLPERDEPHLTPAEERR